MSSLLISALAKRFENADLAAFTAVHKGCWIIWEPGSWKPPTGRSATTLMPMGNAPAPRPPAAVPSPSAEALAFTLVPKSPGATEVTLGRNDSCDLVINDATLSGTHLLFNLAAGGEWMVRDAGSSNGSVLDGQPLGNLFAAALRDSASLRAGQVLLTFFKPAGMLRRLKAAGALAALAAKR